jgi:hypothetical protein
MQDQSSSKDGAIITVFLSLAIVGLLLFLISAFSGHHLDLHPDIDHSEGGFLSLQVYAVFFWLSAESVRSGAATN